MMENLIIDPEAEIEITLQPLPKVTYVKLKRKQKKKIVIVFFFSRGFFFVRSKNERNMFCVRILWVTTYSVVFHSVG